MILEVDRAPTTKQWFSTFFGPWTILKKILWTTLSFWHRLKNN